jgi:diacylglycerol kinase family enzyme
VTSPAQTDAQAEGRPHVRVKHRVYAIVALACAALAGALLLVGVSREFPEFIVALLPMVLIIWLAWRTITRRGKKRLISGAFLLVMILALIIALAWARFDLRILLAIALALLATNVFSSLALSWSHLPSDQHVVNRAHHPVLIINSRSGGGAALKAGLEDKATQMGIQVRVLGEDGDLAQLAKDAVAAGADCIGMAGGDGSLAVVAAVAMEHDLPFVCIPAGTRNHFAMDLGLNRSDLRAGLDAFDAASERRVDVGKVNDRLFLNNVSVGAYGQIVASSEYRDNKLGTTMSRIPDLVGPDAEALDLQFVDDEGVAHESAVVIHVSNNTYDFGPLSLGGRASMSDGLLGIVALVKPDSVTTRPLLRWEASMFDLNSSESIAAGIDGEYALLKPPLKFGIEPMALRLRVPKQVLGISPTAKRPSLTLRTLVDLSDVAMGRWPRSHPRVSLPMRPR